MLGVFKYYSFFVQQWANVARRRRTLAGSAAADDRAARRDQLLHVPGDLLRRRRQAPPRRAGEQPRLRRLPVSFFPHLIAGPIVRAREFLPQLKSPRDPDRVAVGSGLSLIALGLVKKVVIADYLARVARGTGVRGAAGLRRPRHPARRLRLRRARSTATSPATPTWRSASRCCWATSSRRTSAAPTARPAFATSGGAGT